MYKFLLTNVGRDPGDYDLRLVGRDHGVAKVGIVPGVDLALALDQGSIGVPLEELSGEGTVGPCLGRGGHDDGQVKDAAEFGVGVHLMRWKKNGLAS